MRSVFVISLVVVGIISCSSSSTPSSNASGAGGCPPYSGEVQQGDPGAGCDSNGDCKSPTCFCVDGTKGTGPSTCANAVCDGAKSCATFCASHGGAGPCGDAG